MTSSSSAVICPSVSGYFIASDVYHKGDDIKSYSKTSVNALAAACNTNSKCKAFSISPATGQGYTKLKYAPPAAGFGKCLYVKPISIPKIPWTGKASSAEGIDWLSTSAAAKEAVEGHSGDVIFKLKVTKTQNIRFTLDVSSSQLLASSIARIITLISNYIDAQVLSITTQRCVS